MKRCKAITCVSDLVIGHTYYTNSYPESFTLIDLVSDHGLDLLEDIIREKARDHTKTKWIIVSDPSGCITHQIYFFE